jgi:hypothetical protein
MRFYLLNYFLLPGSSYQNFHCLCYCTYKRADLNTYHSSGGYDYLSTTHSYLLLPEFNHFDVVVCER